MGIDLDITGVYISWHYCEGGVPIRIHTANREEATLEREVSGAGPETWTPMKPSVDEKRYREAKEWVSIQWGLPTE